MLLSTLLLALATGSSAVSFADLGIPRSSATVDVKVLNAVANFTLPAQTFLFPVVPGRDNLDIDVYAFLIQHGNDRIMFDLGIRKDPENLAPALSDAFKAGAGILNITADVPTQLQNANISLGSVKSVIWSHSHLDHIGDMSLWPNSTELVIGDATDTRTWPTFANATLLESDFAGRTVRKVLFSNSSLHIGGFSAIDFFGDGSLYLLDVPGHCPGHLAGLARVTPTSFILLAGDTFHQAGQIRPSPHLHTQFPIPQEILDSADKNIARKYFFAPDDQTDLASKTTPFLTVENGPDSVNFNPTDSRISQFQVGVFDSNPDVLVLTAHDPTMHNILEFFPKSLSAWKSKGWKQEGVWQFANSTSRGYRLS